MNRKHKSWQVVDELEALGAGAQVAQVAAVLLCELTGAYLPNSTIVHITYSLDALLHHLGSAAPLGPLGQESIWSSWATYHHASIGRPPAHHGDTTCPYCSALVAQNFCSAAQMQNRLLGCMLNCCPTAPSSSLKQNYNQVIISQLWRKNESIQR